MSKKMAIEQKNSEPHPEARGLIFLGIAIILGLSLITFDLHDINSNWLGLVGWGIAWGLYWAFGLCSYVILAFIAHLGWQALLGRPVNRIKGLYFSLFILSTSLLLCLVAENSLFLSQKCYPRLYAESFFAELPYPHRTTRYYLGGVPFYYLYRDLPTFNLQRMLSDVGIAITFSILQLVSFVFLTGLRVTPLWSKSKETIQRLAHASKTVLKSMVSPKPPVDHVTFKTPQEIENSLTKKLPDPPYTPPSKNKENSLIVRTVSDAPIKTAEIKMPVLTKRQAALNAQKVVNGDFAHYQLPPLSLLNNPKKVDHPSLKKDLRRQAEILEDTLMSFGIEAKVGEINSGPTITSFEVHPAIGVKVQKIKTLENDIALNLQAKSIRIIAPIPGKAAVGVEIPTLYPQEVSFKELLYHYQNSARKMLIPLLLGKGVAGDPVISDLSKMPHCLIAGATGAGKSVCINTLIMSILMNARPDEIKLVMIDPKKVELTPYTHLPHMIAPVITEAHGAYAALSWLVKEMQTRYDILKQLGLRNITAFNNRGVNPELEASLSLPIPPKMHAIVAIIDEFADLMMASSSDLETPIARIAQMARAVGIHLVLATQRPSREVITGLIKANFPTRIAFKVASRINSQIILDDVGAESLLGNGDMLFLPPGTSTLSRAQGAYISDEEIGKVVSFICGQAPPNYLIKSFDQMRQEDIAQTDSPDDNTRDTLYEQALSIIRDTRTASTTYLQRKLKIGYARAASLMDELESQGVISPQEGAKPRRILIEESTTYETRSKSSD